jgi:DNA polymerase-4
LIVPPRFERYQAVSRIIMDLFADFSPRVEALSLDEAFLDMTGSERLFGGPEQMGRKLKAAVRDATGGLTASVGISATKYVAKVASGHAKPDGLTIVAPQEAKAWLAPQPVRNLWGAGPKTSEKLMALGLHTIGDVAARDSEWLEQRLGALGLRFRALANAEDLREVAISREARGLSSERTLNVDVTSRAEIESYLRSAADTVAQRLRRRGVLAHGVRMKLKRSDFQIVTRQRRLAVPSDVAADFFSVVADLLAELDDPGPFRLIGLGAYELVDGSSESQLGLPIGGAGRARRLETAIDRVAERFGAGSVQRASNLVADRGVGVASNLDFLEEDDGDG